MKVRVAIVEDQIMFQHLLASMLRGQIGIEVVATAATVEEGRRMLETTPVDVLVLDLALPDGDGRVLLREARARQPGLRCVVLSGGAHAFVCPADLRDAVHAVVDKAQAYECLHAAIASLAPADEAAPGTDPRTALTDRELEVFRLIGHGRFAKEIASDLHISQLTVETHRKNIGRKLGVTGADLARRAVAYARRSLD